MKYASNTEVPAERSRAEIEKTLAKYDASGFFYAWEALKVVIGFKMHGRMIKFELPLPDKESPEICMTKATNKQRSYRKTEVQIQASYDQAVRQRWRALALCIKAKLESVESGITTFEEEFLAHIVLPNGESVGRWIVPQIEQVYQKGTMPPLLTGRF